MKKLLASAILILFGFGVAAYADDMMKSKVIKGWISDSECAAKGEKMCPNKDHVMKGAKLVFVTEEGHKILTVSNPDKVASHQGEHVQVKGVEDMDKSMIMVEQVKMLK